jgi:hypothetical protein
MFTGIFTLYGGVAVFAIGAGALGRFCWLAFRTAEFPRRRLWMMALACAALLLANFAVAGGIIAAVVAIETRYTVIVHNASDQPLSKVRVFGGGCEAEFGSIPPGGVVRRSFWIQHDGALEAHAVSGAATHTKPSIHVTRAWSTTVAVKGDDFCPAK